MKTRQFNINIPTSLVGFIKLEAEKRGCTIAEAGAALLLDGLAAAAQDGLLTSIAYTRQSLMAIGRRQVEGGGHTARVMWELFTKACFGDTDKALAMMGHTTLMNLAEPVLGGQVVLAESGDTRASFLDAHIAAMAKFDPARDLPPAH